MTEILRPGHDDWESADTLATVPVADVVGSLIRIQTGSAPLVFRVTGLSEPDAVGTRHLQMELNSTESTCQTKPDQA